MLWSLPEVKGIPRPNLGVAALMYDDDDSWPVICPSCGEGFIETIGHIKGRLVSNCPRCLLDFVHSRKQFLFALSEAQAGRHNPWWEIVASSKPDS